MKNGKKCVGCEAPLSGRRRKHCSEKCRMTFLNKKFQNYKSQVERGAAKKFAAVMMLGGKCTKCGYCQNLTSLCFHHTRDKKFRLDFRGFANMSEKSISDELAKCVLLCHNCHQEEHNPDYFMKDLAEKYSYTASL